MASIPPHVPTVHTSDNPRQWFVLRDLSRPNAKTPGYKLLQAMQVTCFTPMHEVIKQQHGATIRVQEPIMKTLLIAYAHKPELDTIIQRYKTLQYRFLYGHKIDNPMVVPHAEMQRFMHAVASSLSKPLYYALEELSADKYGKEVRLIGGKLHGYSGHLLKIRGSKTKRLIVSLSGLFVAAVEVDAAFIQLL